MTHQLDLVAAMEARDEAVARVGENANAEWWDEILHATYLVAKAYAAFTTDQVWVYSGALKTHEPRALGAVLKEAQRRGWIQPTSEYRPSARKACHARPLRVWASRLHVWNPSDLLEREG